MARTIDEIREQVTGVYVNIMDEIGITVDPETWSITNIQRLLIYIFSFCAYTLEVLFDNLKAEILAIIALLKPHTLKWYATKALAYQHGFQLLPDNDVYNNGGRTTADIEESKVVKFAAVVEQINAFGRITLRIKIATLVDGELAAVSQDVLDGIKDYFQRIKDAGIKIIIDSLPPDKLTKKLRIFYDPLILDAQGRRLDGTDNTPVQKAENNYLKNLPFNGMYSLTASGDIIQKVDGVNDYSIDECTATYGALDPINVDVSYMPDSGYLRYESDADLQITFIPRTTVV